MGGSPKAGDISYCKMGGTPKAELLLQVGRDAEGGRRLARRQEGSDAEGGKAEVKRGDSPKAESA
jgi:hypothetical protein